MSTLSLLPHLGDSTWTSLARRADPRNWSVRLSRLARNHSLLNPTLLATLFIAMGIKATGVPYETYFRGSDPVHFMLGPAVVLLAVPLP